MFWQSIGMCTSVYHKQLPCLEPNNLCVTIKLSLRQTLNSHLKKSRDEEFIFPFVLTLLIMNMDLDSLYEFGCIRLLATGSFSAFLYTSIHS